ncbi:Syntaxin 6 N-terminal family protein [Cryptosporidium felis]|nr:Syntaxin 6 N-terminal family protein [Cryptosporidium felis]
MDSKDPYYRAFSEIEKNIDRLVEKCLEYKNKVEEVLDYSSRSDLTDLYNEINLEIESLVEMHKLLWNANRTIGQDPSRFRNISRNELRFREANLKSKYDRIIKCKEEIGIIFLSAKEREARNKRNINRDYLINGSSLDMNKNERDGFYSIGIGSMEDSLNSIAKNTEKLQNAALVISQELSEQNNLIDNMVHNVDEKGLTMGLVYEKMQKTIGISSK